ncbi:MAG: ABC transporter ATP-binding protein [bacterium]|nr:ABC transporter ATP-binding protein [bacterium]
MIEIKNLTKKFDRVTAVSNLNLSIAKGELFGFLGPNGAGKTTTIKIMTGLLRPTFGTVTIGGFDIQRDAIAAKKLIGYVPDDPFIYDKLTGREFLRFIGGLFSLDTRTVTSKIQYWLDFFELNQTADQLTESYSHGMKQKLVTSAALLHDPQVLIIDEPIVGLDPRSTKKLKDLLKELAKNGTTVFLSTHILTVAEELCDRVGIIHQGTLIATGSIPELKQIAKETSDTSLEAIFLKLTGE